MCRKALSSCLGGEAAWQLTEDVQEGYETMSLLVLEGEAGYLLRMCRKDMRQCLFLSRRRGCMATY
jgi:hypothetical protein